MRSSPAVSMQLSTSAAKPTPASPTVSSHASTPARDYLLPPQKTSPPAYHQQPRGALGPSYAPILLDSDDEAAYVGGNSPTEAATRIQHRGNRGFESNSTGTMLYPRLPVFLGIRARFDKAKMESMNVPPDDTDCARQKQLPTTDELKAIEGPAFPGQPNSGSAGSDGINGVISAPVYHPSVGCRLYAGGISLISGSTERRVCRPACLH